MEHSASQGERDFCKNAAEEVYPHTEVARTTYTQAKLAWSNVSCAQSLCWPSAGPELPPACPFHTKRQSCLLPKHLPHSTTAAIKPLLSAFFFQDAITPIALWLQNKVGGEKSQRELPHAANPQRMPSGIMLCLWLSEEDLAAECHAFRPSYLLIRITVIVWLFLSVQWTKTSIILTKCFRKLSLAFQRWLFPWNMLLFIMALNRICFPQTLEHKLRALSSSSIHPFYFIFYMHGGLYSSRQLCKIQWATYNTWFTEQEQAPRTQ